MQKQNRQHLVAFSPTKTVYKLCLPTKKSDVNFEEHLLKHQQLPYTIHHEHGRRRTIYIPAGKGTSGN